MGSSEADRFPQLIKHCGPQANPRLIGSFLIFEGRAGGIFKIDSDHWHFTYEEHLSLSLSGDNGFLHKSDLSSKGAGKRDFISLMIAAELDARVDVGGRLTLSLHAGNIGGRWRGGAPRLPTNH